ncbi:response regulator transcription factor [Ideonella sp. A 288]|uniref:response regulator transcription factor n=1 Tax=Ideonella sp. A 288 TaxID=1962181 RepID=UPI000B4B76D0|nr:response regulator transcription factor [Ideonella sp. A 288]
MGDDQALPTALVVDDHDIFRLGVRHLLSGRAQVTEASSLREARAWLAGHRCDLLMLDLGLGDDFSLTALPTLREAHPTLRIVVLTSMDETLYAERALRAGADGYVMKSASTQAILDAVDAVMAGGIYLSPRLGGAVLRRMAGRDKGAERPELSAREIEVLRLVAEGRSTREIADALNRSVKTIETHKQSLKAKLGADSPAKLVRLAVAWCGDAA